MSDMNSQYQMMETQGYVVQSNKLIQSRQKLNWVEAKLVRLAIMQVLKNDKKFDAYRIPIKTFCELLNIDLDLYCGKNAKKICDGIARKPLQVQCGEDWKIIPWVSFCEYKSKKGDVTEGTITIKLNDQLKPYLIGLEEYYTQYAIEHILNMQSKNIYGLRIFELILSKIYMPIPNKGTSVELSVEEIRICCDCENKYDKIGMLKVRVIDKARDEICNSTIFDVDYTEITISKKIIGFRFFIRKKYYRKAINVSEPQENLPMDKKKTRGLKKRKDSGQEWEQQELHFT